MPTWFGVILAIVSLPFAATMVFYIVALTWIILANSILKPLGIIDDKHLKWLEETF